MSQVQKRPAGTGRQGYESNRAVHSGQVDRTAGLSPLQAAAALYSNPTAAILIAAGFRVETYNGGKHWLVIGHGLRFSYWPSSGKWMIFGRVFRASVKAVITAFEQGRFRMPDDAWPSKCGKCAADIWWLTTFPKGRRLAIELDGDSHLSGCRS